MDMQSNSETDKTCWKQGSVQNDKLEVDIISLFLKASEEVGVERSEERGSEERESEEILESLSYDDINNLLKVHFCWLPYKVTQPLGLVYNLITYNRMYSSVLSSVHCISDYILV